MMKISTMEIQAQANQLLAEYQNYYDENNIVFGGKELQWTFSMLINNENLHPEHKRKLLELKQQTNYE